MHGKRRGLNEVGVMGRVAMKGWAVGCSERQMGGEKQKYDTYINSSSGTENAKKMQLPTLHFLRCIFFATCDVAFSPLHFFCNFDQLLYFFYEKKRKNANKNATAPKQMQRRMRKNATSKVAFSELHFFCNLRRRIFLADFFPFRNLRHCIF
jgi:hypothetical protein